jgi:chromosome partitioning protein
MWCGQTRCCALHILSRCLGLEHPAVQQKVAHRPALLNTAAMILTVGHEKGGCGKTTTATNLAVWLALRGRDVLLVDADRQNSATHWAAVREQDERVLTIPSVQATGNIASRVRDLAGRYQEIVIDCSGRDGAELRSSLVVADQLVVPVRPAQFDLWALEHLAELVISARALNPGLHALAVLSMVDTNPRVTESQEAEEMIVNQEVFDLASAVIRYRKAYRDASRGGWSVVEMDDAKASAEIAALGGEIYGEVQERPAAAV